MFEPRRILHPTDFSEASHYALQLAGDLACQHQATLLILHVVESLGPENVTFGEAATQLEPEGYRQRVMDDLQRSAPAPAGVNTRYLVAEGDEARAIDRIAREERCDLIVMGAHGLGGLARLLTGSITEEVIRQAPCPVLTTRVPPGDAGSASPA